MRKPLQRAVLVLTLLYMTPSLIAAQDEQPATPVPAIDICANFGDPATPAADSVPVSADATFDLAYVDMMITSHQNTIIMLLIAESRAERPELAGFVSDSLIARRSTIEFLLGWRTEHHASAPWVMPEQAMAIFDQVASENPGRGGVAGGREIAAEPHIDELCTTGDQPFDLVLIDHLLTRISAELLLTQGAHDLAADSALAATARDLKESFQREIDALYAWRTLWYPDAELPHSH